MIILNRRRIRSSAKTYTTIMIMTRFVIIKDDMTTAKRRRIGLSTKTCTTMMIRIMSIMIMNIYLMIR